MKVVNVGSDIQVTLMEPDPDTDGAYIYGSCAIETSLERETCEHCGEEDCCYSCDLSVAQMQDATSKLEGDPEEQVAGRLKYNGALDGMESLILALGAAGVDIESPAFQEAVETALNAIGNNL
jgi:hypothetical protein